MIYVDTSVLLVWLFAEDRSPPDTFWSGSLASSRLLEYETWNRIHARDAAETHADPARDLIGRIAFLELAPPVLERALEPFPAPVRTLDALHLASACFLRKRDRTLTVATYDDRFARAAEALDLPVVRP